jgi:Fic family protein
VTPEVISFSANYPRFSPDVSALLVRIGTALGTIQGARILPAVADQLRASARTGTVHFSNLIEGNLLPVIEAERAARGELEPNSRARIELVNYVEALDVLDRSLAAGDLTLDVDLLLELHGVLTRGLGRDEDPYFKPHHEGAWRDGHAVVFDHFTGRVMHEGPPAVEVGPRIAGMFEWLERKFAAGEPAFVIAGAVHYGITDIHPFADGNGRAARLFQTAVLMHAGALPGRMFSFERYYAEDRGAYYAALRSVRERTLNMETWLEYFLAGIAEEYERVAATVADLASLIPGDGGRPLQLTGGQERALAALRIHGRREFTRREYGEAAGVGRSTAGDELRALVQHGIVVPRGAGPSTRYGFAGGAAPGGATNVGRPRKWTDELIESELRTFLDGRTDWPSPGEFRSAGRGALYSAAARAGGIRRWRALVGL